MLPAHAGKQDPYAILRVREQKQRSNVHNEGGKNPIWNQTFLFRDVDPQRDELRIEVQRNGVMSGRMR